MQERTAIQIAEALDLELSPEEERAVRRRYTDNSEAYDEFLQGRAHAQFFVDRDRLQAASEHFERALLLEPDYAPALAGLAMVEALTYRNLDPSEDRLRRADRQVSRALELDPELVAAHASLGIIAAARYEYVAAERSFREAIRLDATDPFAWDLLSWALGYQQPPRAVEAEQAAREAIRLQPEFIYAFYHLGRALLLQERAEEAIKAFRRIEEVVPGSRLGYVGMAQGYLATGQFADAEEAAIEAGRAQVTAVGIVVHAYALAAQGKNEEALAQLELALEA